jgi:hypothetical protein
VRHSYTPDCGVEGCSKAARSLGLCSEHRALVPFEVGIRASLAAAQAAHIAAKSARAEAISLATAALSHYGDDA